MNSAHLKKNCAVGRKVSFEFIEKNIPIPKLCQLTFLPTAEF